MPAESTNGLAAIQLIEMSKLRQSFAAGSRRRRAERKKSPDEGTNGDRED